MLAVTFVRCVSMIGFWFIFWVCSCLSLWFLVCSFLDVCGIGLCCLDYCECVFLWKDVVFDCEFVGGFYVIWLFGFWVARGLLIGDYLFCFVLVLKVGFEFLCCDGLWNQDFVGLSQYTNLWGCTLVLKTGVVRLWLILCFFNGGVGLQFLCWCFDLIV